MNLIMIYAGIMDGKIQDFHPISTKQFNTVLDPGKPKMESKYFITIVDDVILKSSSKEYIMKYIQKEFDEYFE